MIVERFEALARQHPDRTVAWTPRGEQSRRDLLALAAQLGETLRPLHDGVRVGVRLRDGLLFLAALLAVWRRGSAALLLDPAEPAGGDVRDLAALGAAAVLTDAGGGAARLEPIPGDARPVADAGVVKLTSGSTGRPRAVLATQAALVADAVALDRTMGIGDGDRVLAAVPLSFSYGLGSVAIPALWQGRTIVLPDAREPLGLIAAVRRGEPTVMPVVPAFVRAMLASKAPLPPCVRLVLAAGARLDPGVARAFRATHGRPVHVFYGASECGGISYDRTGTAAERGTVGTSVDGVAVTIDPAGRVRVRSPAVATAVEPADDSVVDGTFTAPDLAALRDGELVLLGRVGEAIDLGGYKVQPREIELAILQLPGVEDVAVLPWSAAGARAGSAVLVAGAVDEAAVRRHCVRTLPAGKVPRCVVVVDRLPRNGRGKLERAAAERLLVRLLRAREGRVGA